MWKLLLAASVAFGHKIVLSADKLTDVPPPQAGETLYHGYVASCVQHLKEVTAAIDSSYTDVQAEMVMENECKAAKEFDKTIEDGFKSQGACKHFAEEVVKARAQAVDGGGDAGYYAVCQNYVEHFVKKPAEQHTAPPAEHPVDWGVTMGMFLGAIVVVFIVSLWTARK